MAVALLQKLLGDSALVESAGIDAADGLSPTREAVIVMRELGLNISNHKSRKTRHLDLKQFDTILAMTASVATHLREEGVYAGAIVELNVSDPHGKGIERYRAAAREIESQLSFSLPRGESIQVKASSSPAQAQSPMISDDPVDYLIGSIQQIEDGTLPGSHVEGKFGNAAKDFEAAIKLHLEECMRACSVDYERDIRARKGKKLTKLTLGDCLAVMRNVPIQKVDCFFRRFSKGWPDDSSLPGFSNGWETRSSLLKALSDINEAWLGMFKHRMGPKARYEVKVSVALAQMRSMLAIRRALKLLDPQP